MKKYRYNKAKHEMEEVFEFENRLYDFKELQKIANNMKPYPVAPGETFIEGLTYKQDDLVWHTYRAPYTTERKAYVMSKDYWEVWSKDLNHNIPAPGKQTEFQMGGEPSKSWLDEISLFPPVINWSNLFDFHSRNLEEILKQTKPKPKKVNVTIECDTLTLKDCLTVVQKTVDTLNQSESNIKTVVTQIQPGDARVIARK